MKKNKVRISQCMIVKNEEVNIEKALSWGKGIVWEQIVVDTGSTDRTVELAQAMGAKVYSFEWIDDFAAAKNYAISKAKGEWIAFLDADEVFAPGDAEKLQSLLEEIASRGGKQEGIAATLMNLNEEGKVMTVCSHIRVFRNLPNIRYRGRIHEALTHGDDKPMLMADATKTLSILHSGYQKAVLDEKKRSKRNQRMILKELEEHPEDYVMMGYLGDDYLTRKEYDKAAFWYQKSADLIPEKIDGHDIRSALTLCNLMQIYAKDDEARVDEIYRKAVRLLPEEPDFDYMYGCLKASQKYFEEGRFYLEQAFKKYEQFSSYNRAMRLGAELAKAHEDLAWCCYKTGDSNRALELCVRVLRTDSNATRALAILLTVFRGTGEQPVVPPQQAVGVLEKLLDMSRLKGRYLVLREAGNVGYHELEQYMYTLFSPEEKEQMKVAGLL